MRDNYVGEKPNVTREAPPTIAELLKTAMHSFMQDVRVAIPAEVLDYDYKTQKADVKPCLMRRYKDDTLESLPKIFSVPVMPLRTKNAFIHVPVQKGDYVWLMFADRSLDKWMSSGGEVDPQDTRLHHISDAVAFPGIFPSTESAAVENGRDIIIRNGTTRVMVRPNNHFSVLNEKTEFVKTLCDLVRALREAITYTDIGPQKLHHARFKEIEERLLSFLES